MTAVQPQRVTPSPADLSLARSLGKDPVGLYAKVGGAGRIKLDVSWLDASAQTKLDEKIKGVWQKVHETGLVPAGATGLRMNLTKLAFSYRNASGEPGYINLGVNADTQHKELQELIKDLRHSITGVYKNTLWAADFEDANSRALHADLPFSDEGSPKNLCKSKEEFMKDGSFARLVACVDGMNPNAPSRGVEILKRIEATEKFIQEFQVNVKTRINVKKREIETSEKDVKHSKKTLEILDDEIKKFDDSIVKLTSQVAQGASEKQSQLDAEIAQRNLIVNQREAEQKVNDKVVGKHNDLEKEKELLKGLKKEIKNIDRYALYWAVGMAETTDQIQRANALETAISSSLKDKKIGLIKRTPIEPSSIKKYAEEAGDLILDRLEYIERLDTAEAQGSFRPARKSSIERLVILAAQGKFVGTEMENVYASSGFDRFGDGLKNSLVNALQSAGVSAAKYLV